MKIFRRILSTWILVLICLCVPVVYSEEPPESFVDKWIQNDYLLVEDPADEFLKEKQEINLLYKENSFDTKLAKLLYDKIQDLNKKEAIDYGENYMDWDNWFVHGRLLALNWEFKLMKSFQPRLDGRTLQDEETWKIFQRELEQMTQGSDVPIELNFRLDKNIAVSCEKILGKEAPMTLRRKVYLAHDYSLLGDSKTALEMEKSLLAKFEQQFGKKSREVAKVLHLMASDYKILGNYRKSEETLLKAIAINKELNGEESSPELVANLVDLIKLTDATPDSDKVFALDRAAKNLPEEILSRLGYYRVKILINPVHDTQRLADLSRTYSKAETFIETFHGEDYLKYVDMSFEQSESSRELGIYKSSLAFDLIAMTKCKLVLGNYHHKTLTALCNLSEDYLTLNKLEDALALAEKAYATSREIYGKEHPCTVRTIHSLTNVYRQKGLYNDALAKDLVAHELCKKVFIKSSGGEPLETLKNLIDIADDYSGLKNYSEAIKYYETFLTKYKPKNTHEVAKVRKNLARLYNLKGEYEKTVKLYGFLRQNNSYSLDNLSVTGLIAGQTADVLGEALAIIGNSTVASQIYSQGVINFESVRYFNTHSTSENKSVWFEQTVPYYKKASSFFVSQNEIAKAFRTVELCKGRTLADQYSNLLAVYKGGLTEEDIVKLSDYQEKISRYNDDFEGKFKLGSDALKFNIRWAQLKLLNEYNSYVSQLRKKYPRYDEALSGGMNSGLVSSLIESELFFQEQLKAMIPRDHFYISFAVAKNEILVLVADDKGKLKAVSIPVDKNFFEHCKLYHTLNTYSNIRDLNGENKYLWIVNDKYIIGEGRNNKPEPSAVQIKAKDDKDNAKWCGLRQKISVELSEKLIQPLEKLAGTSSNWIISLDAELNLVPFETLLYRDKMLVESVNVSYVPSLTVMKLMKEAEEKNSRLLKRQELFAMGNAIYENTSNSALHGTAKLLCEISGKYVDKLKTLSNLQGAIKELEQVSKLFSTNSQKILLNREASERTLKRLDKTGELAQYKLILLTAHGMFVPEKPELSVIILNQELTDEEYDNYVTVGEWMGYNFNSNLIYLSTCESGRGDYQAGEGIIGIPYALTIAGNKDTVMSLWKVKDKATAEFTSAFFKRLRDGKSEVVALNETKREFLKHTNKDYRDPSVWAAFVLYGI